jgi:hypothetical protein
VSQLVTVDETCLYDYDPETKQLSVERRHSASPHPKNFQVQKSTGKIVASIFWDQDGILLIIFKKTKLSMWSLISSGAIEGHFEGKMLWEDHQWGSCSCTTMPRLTGHLQHRRNCLTWASSILITHPILQVWPHRTTTCSPD